MCYVIEVPNYKMGIYLQAIIVFLLLKLYIISKFKNRLVSNVAQ
jgi:hypothetical protein